MRQRPEATHKSVVQPGGQQKSLLEDHAHGAPVV